jgi:glutamate decarboxylase
VREKLHTWLDERRILRNKAKMTVLDRNIKKVNQIVNALNIKLHKALRQDDTTFVSRTTLESTRYHPLNIVVLRAILINPLTDEAILQEIVETQNRIGTELWRGFESAYKSPCRR